MALRVKLGSKERPFLWRVTRFFAFCALFFIVVGGIIFFIAYRHFEQVVDDRLAAGPLFAPVAQIYAAPQEIRPGQHLTAGSIAASLKRAGYNQNVALGSFTMRGPDVILIKPGAQSFHSPDGATINATNGEVQSITAENGVSLRSYQLEPQLITALSEDKNRTKRRMVTFKDIPPRMVQAVVAIEDHRFFEHSGINYVRTVKCAVQDVLQGKRECGGSTLTQQLARGFFLTPDKKIKRKLEEIMITYQLESRFNKQQIFEMYANEINLGQRGSYAINGFGEAAQSFFGKDLRQLDTAECALLAGLIQNPNRRNPYRHPDRALERRNLVLDQMVETDAITTAEADRAKAEPIRLAPANVDSSEAPYFVDMVHDQIVQRVGEQGASNGGSLRIYTSLDPDLQRAAAEAVEVGMRNVDELVRKQHGKKSADTILYPQVSLVALNPHTGQILALVGGRNYSSSQLNHALAERPTGSIFKPFVYATAYNTSLNGTALDENGVFTALTRINDDPQNFAQAGQPPYIPGNFEKGEYPGMVTAADAIAHSLNIATIALAQKVGYENVVSLAHSVGIASARPTPSVAIGTYSATPIDMAGAYTTFANGGVHLTPWLLASVRNTAGDVVADFTPVASQVMDPRTAFLTQSLLEGVMSRGTAAAVRSHGFLAPAAGKTGTSHDAWFAGYTSNLICIIWVGNDDYTDVKLEGAKAAAPIWAEFMNRASRLPQYSDMQPFTPPDGVHTYRIDRATNQLADETCPSSSIMMAFLDGTQPQNTCSRMSEDTQTLGAQLFGDDNDPNKPHRNVFQKMFGTGKPAAPPQSPPQ